MRPLYVISLSAGSLLAASGAASAQSLNVACVKGGDTHTIKIVSPGAVGATCDVQYTQYGDTRTPYHANNTASFCTTKANEIIAGLIADGYACGQVGGPLTAEARAPAPAAEPAPAPQPEAAPERAPEPAPEPEAAPVAATPPAPAEPTPVAPPPQPAPAAEPAPQRALDAPPVQTSAPEAAAPPSPSAPSPHAAAQGAETQPDPTSTLEEPALTTTATRGPASLAGDSLVDVQRVVTPAPAGRLVGASPSAVDASPLPDLNDAQPATDAAASAPAPTPAATPAPAVTAASAPPAPAAVETPAEAAAPAAQPAKKSERRSKMRRPEDIVMATLQAQIAAWNEGNLQAFMDYYARDDGMKFISGTTMMRGWSTAMKHYRERYGDESGLGRLTTEKTDVDLITDDVAIVTGRYSVVKDEKTSTGAFTLVLKQMDGVWRIVHDHSVSDRPAG